MIDNFALLWGIAGLAYVLWRLIKVERTPQRFGDPPSQGGPRP